MAAEIQLLVPSLNPQCVAMVNLLTRCERELAARNLKPAAYFT